MHSELTGLCLETWFIYIDLSWVVCGVRAWETVDVHACSTAMTISEEMFGGGRFSGFLDYCVCTCTCVYLHVAPAFCGLLCTVQSFQHLLYASSHCSHLVLYYLLRIVFLFFFPHSGIVIIIELYSVILLPHFAQKYRNESWVVCIN